MALDLVGKTLGDYQVEEQIGEGGMATVFKAAQISLNRHVAVKVLHYREDTSLVRFEREAKAIASLRHRNILIIYEYGEQDGLPFIAMEYVAGGTLEDRLTVGEPYGVAAGCRVNHSHCQSVGLRASKRHYPPRCKAI